MIKQWIQSRGVLTILLTALVLRLSLPLIEWKIFGKGEFVFAGDQLLHYCTWGSDDLWYGFTAHSLVEGEGFSVNDENVRRFNNPVWYTAIVNSSAAKKIDGNHYHHKMVFPAYPFFLAGLFRVFGFNTLAYFIPQALLGALTAVLVFFIALPIFGRTAAQLAAFFVVFYPDLIFWCYHLRIETFLTFLIALTFLLLPLRYKHSLLFSFFSGFVAAITVMTKPVFVFFIPVIFVFDFWKHSCQISKCWKKSISFLLPTFLLASLWIMRNDIVFGHPSFFSDEAASILLDYYPLDTVMKMKSHADSSFLWLWVEQIYREPMEFLTKTWDRILLFFSLFKSGSPLISKIYKTMSWVIIFPASFMGMAFVLRARLREGYLLLAFVVYFAGLHAMSHVEVNLVYRYPIIPFLSIFAAHFYSHVLWGKKSFYLLNGISKKFPLERPSKNFMQGKD